MDINVTVTNATTINVTLTAITSWIFDSANHKWILSVGGVQVAELDANGNLGIKGRVYEI